MVKECKIWWRRAGIKREAVTFFPLPSIKNGISFCVVNLDITVARCGNVRVAGFLIIDDCNGLVVLVKS